MNKQTINHLADLYLDSIENVCEAAGRSGESMLSKMITYKGFIPGSTNRATQDDAMVHRVERMPNEHAEFKAANAMIARLVDVNWKFALALLSSRFYRRKCPSNSDTYCTDKDMADAIGQTLEDYLSNKESAYFELMKFRRVA